MKPKKKKALSASKTAMSRYVTPEQMPITHCKTPSTVITRPFQGVFKPPLTESSKDYNFNEYTELDTIYPNSKENYVPLEIIPRSKEETKQSSTVHYNKVYKPSLGTPCTSSIDYRTPIQLKTMQLQECISSLGNNIRVLPLVDEKELSTKRKLEKHILEKDLHEIEQVSTSEYTFLISDTKHELYAYNKATDFLKRLTNFTMSISATEIRITKGEERKTYLELSFNKANETVPPLSILKEKYRKCKSELEKYPQLQIDNSTGQFDNYLTYVYDNRSDVEVITYEKFNGWIKANGHTWSYINANHKAASGCNLELIKNIDDAQHFLTNFFQVFKKEKQHLLTALLLYSLFGYICRPYLEDVEGSNGFKAPLIIHGPTQAGKTRTAKLVMDALLINKNETDILTTSSTNAALIEKMRIHNNRIIMLDDLHPHVTRQGAENQREKTEQMVRALGDNMLPAKMQGTELAPTVPYYGAVIATAEVILLNSESSYARTIILPLKPGDALHESSAFSNLEQHRNYKKAFFSAFILWFEENQDRLLKMLRHWTSVIKPQGKDRVANSIKMFMIMKELFSLFLEENNLTLPDVELTNDHMETVYNLCRNHSIHMTNTEIVKAALHHAYKDKKIKLAESKKAFQKDDSDGYYDENDPHYFLIGRQKFLDLITDYARSHGKAIDTTKVLDDLYHANLLKSIAPEKFSLERVIAKPIRPQLYRINNLIWEED